MVADSRNPERHTAPRSFMIRGHIANHANHRQKIVLAQNSKVAIHEREARSVGTENSAGSDAASFAPGFWYAYWSDHPGVLGSREMGWRPRLPTAITQLQGNPSEGDANGTSYSSIRSGRSSSASIALYIPSVLSLAN